MIKPQKVQTAILPTPLHKLERMTAQLDGVDLYIKRDDMTGLAFGGNKLRKLDYIVKYCLDNNYTTILTHGGQQTNHGRLTAAACAKFGLKSVIVAGGLPPEKMSGNIVIDRMLDAEVVYIDRAFLEGVEDKEQAFKLFKQEKDKCVEQVIARYEAQGDKVYDLPVGGHTHLAMWGYVDCVEEIMTQMKEQNIDIDYVVVGNGSGATYGGMVLGAKLHNAPFKIVAANIAPKTQEDYQIIVDFINETSDMYEMGVKVTLDDMSGMSDYCGIGYNIPDEYTRKVMYNMARQEGIMVDPCYTGKSLANCLGLIENGTIPKGSKVLFVHTGGTPGIYTECHLDGINQDIWEEKKTVFHPVVK